MDQDAANRSPKTLADVSHLFFSRAEETSDEGTDEASAPPAGACGPAPEILASAAASPEPHAACGPAPEILAADGPPAGPEPSGDTKIFVVTGGEDHPGKSTIAANLANALLRFGRVSLHDADPRIPNARFYLGLPSWNYLSPMTGAGEPAPNTATESGLVVVDWVFASEETLAGLGSGDVVYLDAPGVGRRPVDSLVVDLPVKRLHLLRGLEGRAVSHIVVARPGRRGFENAFAALKAICRVGAPPRVALVVNRVPDHDYAARFHAKTALAAERLLSMKTEFLGAVTVEAGLAGEERERGVITAAKPDSPTALSLRQLASRALDFAGQGRR
jgi:flagellar biosynthesis protein FlhG